MRAAPEDHLRPWDGYAAFLAAARQVEDMIRSRPDTSDTDVAEGYLYLAGMWAYYIERMFKSFDLDRPCFVRDMDTFRTWGCPSPDHHYLSAQIAGDGEYRIMGYRGVTADYCFETLTGLASDGGVIGERIDALESRHLQVDADGRFEVFVGGGSRSGNWLKSGPNATAVFVRQTVSDWGSEQPTPLLIERMGSERPFRRPTPEHVQSLFRLAAEGMVDNVRFQNDLSLRWSETLPLNDLPAPSVGPTNGGYFPGQLNTKCRFGLGAGEVLIVTIEPNTSLYQGVALSHPHWFNSIHYRNVQSSLSGAQARVSSDGLYRFVISASDPGVANWLDTSGLDHGFLFVRWQRVSGRLPKKPNAKIVSISQVRSEFPADEPLLDQAARAANLRMRRLSADRRFA